MIYISFPGEREPKEPRERIVRPWQPIEIDLKGRHPRVYRGYRYKGRARLLGVPVEFACGSEIGEPRCADARKIPITNANLDSLRLASFEALQSERRRGVVLNALLLALWPTGKPGDAAQGQDRISRGSVGQARLCRIKKIRGRLD
jgi:hypothetical protein